MTEVRPLCVLVIGIGNPDRGDDGCGAAVIARLQASPRPGLFYARAAAICSPFLMNWTGSTWFLVDAAAPLVRPGQTHRLDLSAGPLPTGLSPSSTHAVGVGNAIELARSLGRLPRCLILYLVEGENFAAGRPLSPGVAAAADRVAEKIRVDIAVLLPRIPRMRPRFWAPAAVLG